MNPLISNKNVSLFIIQRYGLHPDAFLNHYSGNEKIYNKAIRDIYWEFTRTHVRDGKVFLVNPFTPEPKDFDLGTCKKPENLKELVGHLSETYHERKRVLEKQHTRLLELDKLKKKQVNKEKER